MQSAFEQARQDFVAGVRAFEAGRLDEAEAAFERARALMPGRASVLSNLAAVRIRRGRAAAALPLLDELLAQAPSSPDALDALDALCHRGEALAALGRPQEALADFDRALALQPGQPAVRFHRAVQLAALERHAEALQMLQGLLAERDDHVESWLRLGLVLQALQRPLEALAAFERANALDATQALAWTQRGAILKDLQRLPEAATCLRQALAHGGDAALNRYYLAAVEGAAGGAAPGAADAALPPTAPRHYVEGLFDSYAEGFDEHLTQRLGYRTPQSLVDLLPPGRRFRAALDLGCGTGLMAPPLAPRCAALDGVDLSTRMLAQARARGLYRELVHGDIVEYMDAAAARWDLVVAADVFIYVGVLEAVFAAVARVLEPGGLFAFSLEEAAPGREIELRPSSRYAHAEAYARRLAATHGFEWQVLKREALRHEQRQPIGGLLIVLGKR